METMLVRTLPQTRQTWRDKPVRELFADLVAKHPTASEDDLRRHFREEAAADQEYLNSIIDYAFDAAWRAYERQTEREPITATARAAQAMTRAAELKQHAERVEFIKEQIILLNQEMPNGKRARNCTLDYMYRLGGAYRKIGKQGSSRIVGAVYNEEEYRRKLKGLA